MLLLLDAAVPLEVSAMAYELVLLCAVAGLFVALLPGFAFLLYFARRRGRLWIAALLGGVFWLLALLARLPIVIVVELVPSLLLGWYLSLPLPAQAFVVLVILFVSSLCAGLFEEGFKYLLVRHKPDLIETPHHVLCLGLGWGLMEAFLLAGLSYIVIIALFPLLPLLAPYLGPEAQLATGLLAGGFERDSAIVVHVSLSVFVAMAAWYADRKWLWSAMFLHFIYDFSVICVAYGLVTPLFGSAPLGVWLLEALVAVEALVIALLAYLLWQRKGGPPKAAT
jgi:uncharacterized membrane protein YhfC